MYGITKVAPRLPRAHPPPPWCPRRPGPGRAPCVRGPAHSCLPGTAALPVCWSAYEHCACDRRPRARDCLPPTQGPAPTLHFPATDCGNIRLSTRRQLRSGVGWRCGRGLYRSLDRVSKPQLAASPARRCASSCCCYLTLPCSAGAPGAAGRVLPRARRRGLPLAAIPGRHLLAHAAGRRHHRLRGGDLPRGRAPRPAGSRRAGGSAPGQRRPLASAMQISSVRGRVSGHTALRLSARSGPSPAGLAGNCLDGTNNPDSPGWCQPGPS
jgi:hypothetical protein